MGGYPRGRDLATITAPVVCTYGSRSRGYMRSITRSLAEDISMSPSPPERDTQIDRICADLPFSAEQFSRIQIGSGARSMFDCYC